MLPRCVLVTRGRSVQVNGGGEQSKRTTRSCFCDVELKLIATTCPVGIVRINGTAIFCCLSRQIHTSPTIQLLDEVEQEYYYCWSSFSSTLLSNPLSQQQHAAMRQMLRVSHRTQPRCSSLNSCYQ